MIRNVVVGMMLAVGLIVGQADAQFKEQLENQPSPSQGLFNQNASIGNFLGILNPDNFTMRHSFSLDYMMSGGGSLSLASYTNSMFYKISDPLNVRFDLTLMGSPYGSFAGYQQNDFNKLFISRAEVNYKPWDNTLIRLEYNELPYGRNPYYDDFSSSRYFWDR